ncbi:GNAT family N-acetyltransferase [Pedobacter cryoconitis]|uniref:GNAT superfamily N-acetyltransferase n=1 Tax=Pedobacter cryoconitis TaxID=188932 RepID=A0A7X0MHA4_9SPHI|nr:GNAT family N-acetyltransferase [Pedobacter cryoconitis]MBB6499187.1 GNAT superfamily N-acetyltransferase [Pedobacter cryoconitis]
MKIISVREHPAYLDRAIKYLQTCWSEVEPIIYEDCLTHCINAQGDFPQWYLLEEGGEIIGCGGLVPNDFISRMDLYPWVCALYIDEKHRGKALSKLILDKAREDTVKASFDSLYLCTDHIGFYEKYGYEYIGMGYHPWEEESRIYKLDLK